MAKKLVRITLRGIAVIAAAVFIIAPVSSGMGLIFFVSSIVVLLACLLIWHLVADRADGGYWPDEPGN